MYHMKMNEKCITSHHFHYFLCFHVFNIWTCCFAFFCVFFVSWIIQKDARRKIMHFGSLKISRSFTRTSLVKKR